MGQVHVLSLHEGTVDLLLVDVLDHRLKQLQASQTAQGRSLTDLVVVASELLVVVVHLHPRSPPGAPGHHLDT